MKRTVLTLVIATALAFAVAANAQFARGLGTLQGTVVDAHGKLVVDASVTIQTSDGLSPHATHTDANGHFEFARFDAGQYDVRAYSNGQFSDWDKRVVIRPKKTTDITLRMPPKSDVKVNVSGE
ncbi:MAG: carboxypeptidase-like regulatory domain-containing protein [Candidatus Acidiferrales bacterium]